MPLADPAPHSRSYLRFDFSVPGSHLQAYPGNLLFSVHDHQFIDEVANRIIEFPLDKGGVLDYEGSYDDFVQWKKERA